MATTNSDPTALHKGDDDAPPGWISMKGFANKMRGRDRKDQSAVLTMENVESNVSADNALREVGSADGLLDGEYEGQLGNHAQAGPGASRGDAQTAMVYKVYKRRWFGLLQLALLNIIVSWDVSAVFLSYMRSKEAD